MIFGMLACFGPKKELQSIQQEQPYVWQAPLEKEHALVGKIWSTSNQSWILYSEMVDALQSKQHIFIGEKHDNPDHHDWQAKILQSIHKDRAVAFEMLSVDQKPESSVQDSLALAVAVGWEKSGWPDFDMYKSIFDVVFTNDLPIVYAHPQREDVMRVMKQGFNEEDNAWLEAGEPLSDSAQTELQEEISASHCGHASDGMVKMMINAQQYKDAFMSKEIRDSEKKSVLIAGTGHTRQGKGMPRFFNEESVAVVHMVEVLPQNEDITSYGQDADYLIFTPRMSNEDPCEVFRKQLEQMKK